MKYDAKYYAARERSGEDSYWAPLNATTLLGAKMEAYRELGGGFNDSKLLVGEPVNGGAEIYVLATRADLYPGTRWVSLRHGK